MNRQGLFVVMCLLLSAAACAQEVVREQPVTLQLDIDAHGQVTAAKAIEPVPLLVPRFGRLVKQQSPIASLPPLLSRAAEQVATRWLFKPFLLGGHPASGRTWATATLQIVKRADGNFGVALRYKRNGPHMAVAVAPESPAGRNRPGDSGAIVMEYTVEADGSIDKIQATNTFGDAVNHQDAFEDSARESLLKSRYLPVQINGKGVATIMRTPFIFVVDLHVKGDTERLERQVEEAIGSKSENPEGTRITSGESFAVNSPFAKQPQS